MHEFGHVIGLGDLYSSICQDTLMFGYIAEDEYAKMEIDASTTNCAASLYNNTQSTLPWFVVGSASNLPNLLGDIFN